MSFFALVDGRLKIPTSLLAHHKLSDLYEADIDEAGVILLTPIDAVKKSVDRGHDGDEPHK